MEAVRVVVAVVAMGHNIGDAGPAAGYAGAAVDIRGGVWDSPASAPGRPRMAGSWAERRAALAPLWSGQGTSHPALVHHIVP
jgi:hypothetical protein